MSAPHITFRGSKALALARRCQNLITRYDTEEGAPTMRALAPAIIENTLRYGMGCLHLTGHKPQVKMRVTPEGTLTAEFWTMTTTNSICDSLGIARPADASRMHRIRLVGAMLRDRTALSMLPTHWSGSARRGEQTASWWEQVTEDVWVCVGAPTMNLLTDYSIRALAQSKNTWARMANLGRPREPNEPFPYYVPDDVSEPSTQSWSSDELGSSTDESEEVEMEFV